MKKDKITIILVIFLIIGISLLLYPSISDYWNASRSTKIISEYSNNLSSISTKKIDGIIEDAEEYNKRISNRKIPTEMTKKEIEEYNKKLKIEATDIMATLDIPSINVSLPIYHGTSESVLQSGLGHLEWTSLPVGGRGTHATITGHRGLISARLLTDIDQLELNDLFYIKLLGKKLNYEVDQIKIVLPHEINELLPISEKDYVTLLTCTPYGINTHRLLIRGHRISDNETIHITNDAVPIKSLYVAIILLLPISIIFSLIVVYFDNKKNRKERIRRRFLKND